MKRKKLWIGVVALAGLALLFAGAGRIPAVAQDGPRDANRAHFSGDVDDRVDVHFRGDHGWTTTVSGRDPRNTYFSFDTPLPDAPVVVFVRHSDGRGDVSIRQQPTADNNYEAVIRIHDPQSGFGHYDVNIGWQ